MTCLGGGEQKVRGKYGLLKGAGSEVRGQLKDQLDLPEGE
jgi:hypothetical protein